MFLLSWWRDFGAPMSNRLKYDLGNEGEKVKYMVVLKNALLYQLCLTGRTNACYLKSHLDFTLDQGGWST